METTRRSRALHTLGGTYATIAGAKDLLPVQIPELPNRLVTFFGLGSLLQSIALLSSVPATSRNSAFLAEPSYLVLSTSFLSKYSSSMM